MSAPDEIEAKPSKNPINKPDNNAQIASSASGSEKNDYYEMYYDTSHKAPYYFNPKTGASIWQLPSGAIWADMTEGNLEKINKSFLKEEEEEEDMEPTEHQKKKIEIEELKKKNLEIMYPELANATDQVNQASDEDEPEADIENFEKVKKVLHEDIMKRPARKQIKDMRNETAYIEGNYDYNIWYDKFLTDQRIEEERVTSMYKLDANEDSGYTKADKFDKAGYFCTYYARGCCSEGVNCRFYHRVPQPSDIRNDEMIKDWFGRTKHAKFKEDFTGIGTFSEDWQTLKITDIAIPDRSKPVRELLRIFYESFAPWGDLIDIHLNVSKWVGFVKYSHRFYAEFAREAMYDQAIFGGTDPITLRWAPTNPFEKKEQELENKFISEMGDLKERQKMMKDHAQRAVKEINKKAGVKRNREEEKFDDNLMDNKRTKHSEEDPNAPVDNKEIADNLSKLSSVFQRMEKASE